MVDWREPINYRPGCAEGDFVQAAQWLVGNMIYSRADEDLVAEVDPSKVLALERAMAWLEWMLSRGPVMVTVIETLAPLHGQQDWVVVEEAKAALGVEAVTIRARLWWQVSNRIAVPEDAPPSKT